MSLRYCNPSIFEQVPSFICCRRRVIVTRDNLVLFSYNIIHAVQLYIWRLIESNTTLREGRGIPIRVSNICNPRRIFDTSMGFPSPFLNVVIDYFSHSCLKFCKICRKRILDATFLDCLMLTFNDVIGKLLPEWACLILQGGTTFLLTSKLANIPVSRVRKR